MKAIFRKEMADYFTSIRVFILFVLTLLTSLLALYSAQSLGGTAITEFAFLKLFTAQSANIPTQVTFLYFTALFFIPIIGITLGFDVINSEYSGRTLSRILSQPVFRDNVINAKFLAGITTLSIMVITTLLLVTGYGLGFRLIGSPIAATLNAVLGLGFSAPMAVPLPSFEEVFRLFFYLVFAIVYGAFWLGLSILCSVLFRRISTSLLTSIAIWLFFGLFYTFFIAPTLANIMAPATGGETAAVVRNFEMQLTLLRFSPNFLFSEVSTVLLQPPAYGSLLLANLQVPGNPLSLGQSMLLVWPHFTLLVSVTLICFAISYVVFMRQEIRST